MRSSLGKGKSRIRVGAAWALAAVVLCAHSCSAKLEVGETVGATEKANVHTECYPSVDSTHTLADFDYQANGGKRYVTAVATYFTGCGPGRDESPVFSKYADEYAASAQTGEPQAKFMASLKNGVNSQTCQSWATLGGRAGENLLFIDDQDRTLAYSFFEIEHPAYILLDHCMKVRYRFLEGQMSTGIKVKIDELLAEAATNDCASSPGTPTTPVAAAAVDVQVDGQTPAGKHTCVPEFGAKYTVARILNDDLPRAGKSSAGFPFLAKPRALGWNPITGELWVVNNNTESATVLGNIDVALKEAARLHPDSGIVPRSTVQDALALTAVTAAGRRDRGWYHYLARVSAISFDSRGLFATCQESENDYDLKDKANFFMGPTLYNASDALLKQADGAACAGDDRSEGEPCYLSHIDMLHESPMCVGITHDPAARTPYDNVYWAIGARYEPTQAEYTSTALTLLRYDFERPHGVGVLDHSQANVRRYHDVKIKRRPGVPGHVYADPESNALYIADTGNGRILVVDRSSGSFDRSARLDQGGEFLLWSAAEARFEYSIYQCVKQRDFAKVASPSGIVGSRHHIFVSDHDSGDVVAFEKGSGREVARVSTGGPGIMGLAVHADGSLWFVNGLTNEIGRIAPFEACAAGAAPDPAAAAPAEAFNTVTCLPPNTTGLAREIAHVNHDCGYQNQSDMCMGEQYGKQAMACSGPDSLNLDMLLMTGHYCHRCLPEPCLNGGSCTNIWSKGYACTCAEGFKGSNCQWGVDEDYWGFSAASRKAGQPTILAALPALLLLLLLPVRRA